MCQKASRAPPHYIDPDIDPAVLLNSKEEASSMAWWRLLNIRFCSYLYIDKYKITRVTHK